MAGYPAAGGPDRRQPFSLKAFGVAGSHEAQRYAVVGMQEIVAALQDALALLHHHLPWDRLPDPSVLAAMVTVTGLIFCFWGARLLRTLFVLGFLAGGISLGIRLARMIPVDDLFGLVIGGAIAAIIGHLLYRWWVGFLAGSCAVILVLMVGGPKVLPQVIQDFQDHLYGGEGAVYVLPEPPSTNEGTAPTESDHYWTQLKDYLWNQQRDFTTRMALALALAWLLGFIVGVTLTRTAAIIGTSLLGVLAVGLAGSTLISIHWPTLWTQVQTQPGWLLGGLSLLLIISLSLQARGGRPVQVVAVGATPPNN